MYSLIWLPKVLKDAGLKVALVNGWASRGNGDVGEICGVLCHHTGGPRDGNMPSLNILVKGRSDLPGPLAQLGLGRDGTYYVIAAGKCSHAGKGIWNGVTTGNTSFIGIEAEHSGKPEEKWPDEQKEAYYYGVAAILKHIGLEADCCAGHKEYALPKGRKPDPLLDMNEFRARVNGILKNGTVLSPVISAFAEINGERKETMRRGHTGDLVKQIQKAVGINDDGHFGPNTEAAVRLFQRTHNLVPDGIVGPKTWEFVDKELKKLLQPV